MIYFDIVQKHLPLINREKFQQIADSVDPPHQHLALMYAVAMSGASCAQNPIQIEEQCYLSARNHLDKAETQLDSSSFWNVETVQALILLARFEFTKANAARALLTTSRFMQLINLLGYDLVDRNATQSDRNRFASLASFVNNPTRLKELRHTFWIAFSMHCHGVANAGGPGTVESDEVGTQHVVFLLAPGFSSRY